MCDKMRVGGVLNAATVSREYETSNGESIDDRIYAAYATSIIDTRFSFSSLDFEPGSVRSILITHRSPSVSDVPTRVTHDA